MIVSFDIIKYNLNIIEFNQTVVDFSTNVLGINESIFLNFENYKPRNSAEIYPGDLDRMFVNGQLELLSNIELENVVVVEDICVNTKKELIPRTVLIHPSFSEY